MRLKIRVKVHLKTKHIGVKFKLARRQCKRFQTRCKRGVKTKLNSKKCNKERKKGKEKKRDMKEKEKKRDMKETERREKEEKKFQFQFQFQVFKFKVCLSLSSSLSLSPLKFKKIKRE